MTETNKKLRGIYHEALYENCLPFWLDNCVDPKYGGYITCLDRRGREYNTDKSVWFQGRGIWMFSKLINSGRHDERLLDAASKGYDFLVDNCFDDDARMFFIVTREGRPVQKRRYYYSETFAVAGLAEYSKASGNTEALNKARQIYDNIFRLYNDPSLITPKYYPETFRYKAMAVPMILLGTTQSLREIDKENKAGYDKTARELSYELINSFVDRKYNAMFENVTPEGIDTQNPKGRLINPGHSIEAAWFLLTEAMHQKDDLLKASALEILNWSFELGWDKEYGGIMYFVDIEGKPAEQLEWDMKLWWPHTEALYAFMLAYHVTGDRTYLEKFNKVHDYSFDRFADKEHGEWYGYLHRDGTVSNTLKGSLFKGPYHLPRALYLIHDILKGDDA